jgi:hypothetical protein
VRERGSLSFCAGQATLRQPIPKLSADLPAFCQTPSDAWAALTASPLDYQHHRDNDENDQDKAAEAPGCDERDRHSRIIAHSAREHERLVVDLHAILDGLLAVGSGGDRRAEEHEPK